VAAYRIVTEALTNVVRHARAEAVDVTLARVPDGLAIEVRDDGVGLAATVDVGVGLDSMHQRAAELGGRCTVAAGQTRGTIVEAWLPMEER
jgi:two-component system, NarL family, sensor kinase